MNVVGEKTEEAPNTGFLAQARRRLAGLGRGRLARWAWVPLSYWIASLALYWPLPRNLHAAAGADRVDPFLVVSLLEWMRAKFPWHLATWENATYFYPARLTTYWSELLLGYWPLYGPLRALIGDPLSTLNALLVTLPALGASGSFVLAWRATGSRASAWLAGFLASISMPLAGQALHFQFSSVAALPWLWLVWLRLTESGRRRWAVGLGAGLAGLFVTSVYVFHMASLSLAGHTIWMWARSERPRPPVRRLALAAGVFAALAGYFIWRYVLASHMLLPSATAVYDRLAVRHSARLSDFLGVAGQHHLWSWALTRPGRSERVFFLGFVCVALGAYALYGAVRNRGPLDARGRPCRGQILWLAAWAAVTVAVAVGPWPGETAQLRFVAPFYWLRRIVPGFNVIRAPGRFMLLAMLPLGLLAGHGLKRLQERGAPRWAVAALMILGVAEHMPGGIETAPANHRLPQTVSRAYAVLAERNRQRPVVILDFPSPDQYWRAEYMYFWSQHQLPMMSGYSGLTDDLSEQIIYKLMSQPVSKWPQILAESPATHLVIHAYANQNFKTLWGRVNDAFGDGIERFDEDGRGVWPETWLITLSKYSTAPGRGQAPDS